MSEVRNEAETSSTDAAAVVVRPDGSNPRSSGTGHHSMAGKPPGLAARVLPWACVIMILAAPPVVLYFALLRQIDDAHTVTKAHVDAQVAAAGTRWTNELSVVSTNVAVLSRTVGDYSREVLNTQSNNQTAFKKQTEELLSTAMELGDRAAELLKQTDEAKERAGEVVGALQGAQQPLATLKTLVDPLNAALQSLQGDVGYVREYLSTLHDVEHTAVVVVCNAGSPSPARIRKALEEFALNAPFPMLYSKYGLHVLMTGRESELKSLYALDRADATSTRVARAFDQLVSDAVAGVTLETVCNKLKRELFFQRAVRADNRSIDLVLIVSRSTLANAGNADDISSLPTGVRLHMLMVTEGDPAPDLTFKWTAICRRRRGVFDYVDLNAAAAASTPTAPRLPEPAASSTSIPGASVPGTTTTVAAPQPPQNAAPQGAPQPSATGQPAEHAGPPAAATPPIGPPAGGAPTTVPAAAPSHLQPQQYTKEFLLRVCQPVLVDRTPATGERP